MTKNTDFHYIPDCFRLYAPDEKLEDTNASGDWRTTDEKVYPLGKKRGEAIKKLNQKYGYLTWRFAWQIHFNRCVPFRVAVGLYEKSYEEHLRANQDKVQYLVENASDVFDNDESNIVSGFNYFIQGKKLTHLQDIAIRRVMRTMQQRFSGGRLIRVRKSRNADAIGRSLSPKYVPFCDPELVQGFDHSNGHSVPSIEDFWQNNRVVQFSESLAKMLPRERQSYVESPISFD
jgi:hypothetical protein